MTNDGSGWGVIVANNAGFIPLASLGLTAGETYTFRQDMKLFSGNDLGKLKVEFQGAGDTGDITTELIGDGSTWETYEFQVPIPPGVESIKVVPVAGIGSSVGYDNVGFEAVTVIAPPVLNADFESGGANWIFFADPNIMLPEMNSAPSFPETGGNPGRFAQIENFNSFAGFIANGGAIIPAEKFGFPVEGGDSLFQMDMKIIAGSSIGGMKVEFYDNGVLITDTGDMFPALIGDGSTWETYTFNFFVPSDIDGIKIIPLWGPDSTVGYDNIVTPIGIPSGFAGWISQFPGVGTETGFNDDPDNDGSPNGLENFFGTDPSVSSQGLIAGLTIDSAFSSFFFSHPESDSPSEDISEPIYEWSTDLENFYGNGVVNPDGVAIFFDTESNTPAAGMTTVEASVTGSLQEKIFVRVRVAQVTQ